MGRDGLLTVARRASEQKRALGWHNYTLAARLAGAKASRESWRAKAKNAGGCGEVKKVADELVAAHKKGRFDGKRALFHFITDLVRFVGAEPDKNGHHGHVRWHESTHRFFQILRKLGGPRTQRFMVANFGGPVEDTTRKIWNRSKRVIVPGIHAEAFTHLETVYSRVRSRAKWRKIVLCEASEDEVGAVRASARQMCRVALPRERSRVTRVVVGRVSCVM